jgi:hypothetical protein
VQARSVFTVPFETDVHVGHFVQCRSSNNANIKFVCRLGKSASETLSILQQVYADTSLRKYTVYDWVSWFNNGQQTLEDGHCSGRPSTSRTEEMFKEVWQLILSDRRMTV